MKPAPLTNDEWIWRWQYCAFDDYSYLHRIAAPFAVGKKQAWTAHLATAMCGLRARFNIPGAMSRERCDRCERCCELMSIPQGGGSPYNDKTLPQPQKEA